MIEMQFDNVNLHPDLASGGRTIVGPIPLLANAATKTWISVIAKASLTTAQFTVKTNTLSGLQNIDSGYVNTGTLTMTGHVIITGGNNVDEAWLELAAEEASAASCSIVVRTRTAADDAGQTGGGGGGKA